MADGISQNNRLFSFDSPLGDTLLCNAFSGTEEMSSLFHFNLELVSEDFNIDWQSLLNRNVTVGLRLSDNSFRYFNGYIIRFEPTKHQGRLGYYKAEMVPWLWFLTQTQNCRVHQEMTVVEVMEEIFDEAGFSGQYDVSKLSDRHADWINCCQYRETAFDFISRLAEIEGIYYYFKHERGKHTLMMVDHLSAHLPLPGQSTIQYAHDEGGGALRTEDTITESSMRKLVKPSKYAHKDYNFLIPKANLYHEGDVHTEVAGDRELEIYDYPGEYEWPKDAPDWGTLRQQELEFDHAVMTGAGTCRAMAPGYRFDLENHPRQDLDDNYLITTVTHHAHEGSFGAGFDSNPASYDNGFSAIPSSVQFRPTRKTETPNVASIQTATVVGPKGEEIYTDEYGRVKVQFHWDREEGSENSSCWIRVAQMWAGANWGQIWIPRVGMEVIIQFLEGDPDRPVITGCLYNEENRPPYKLPEKKNWSGIMSRSTKGGKATEYNELRFDDTKGSELHLLHAQKDMQITVNNDTIESIKRDRTLNVKRNQIEQVEGDKHATVKGNFNQKIGGNLSQKVGGNIAVNAAGDIVLKAEGNICIIAGGVINLTAGGGITMSGGSGMGGLGGALSGMAGAVGGGVAGLAGAASGMVPGVAGAAANAMDAAKGAVPGLADVAGGGGGALPGDLGNQISNLVNSSMAGIGSGLPLDPGALVSQISSLVNASLPGIPGGLPVDPNVLASQLNTLVNSHLAAAGGMPIDPAALSDQISNTVSNLATSQGGGAGGMGGGMPGDLANAAMGGMGGGMPGDLANAAMGGMGGGMPGDLANAAMGGMGGGMPGDLANAAMGGMGGGMPGDLANAAMGGMGGMADAASAAMEGMGGGMAADAANAVMGGAAAGIPGDLANAAAGAIPGAANPLAGGLGGALPGAGGCFISVNAAGIIIQGSPMIWLNCGLPAPPGTCSHTPVVPTLPDLSKLAASSNLGGGANPKIPGMAKPPGAGGDDIEAALMDTMQGDSGGMLSGELAAEAEGMLSSLASNPWVNPSSLGGPSLSNFASQIVGQLSSLAPNINVPGVNIPNVQTVLDTVTNPPQNQPPAPPAIEPEPEVQPDNVDAGVDPEGVA